MLERLARFLVRRPVAWTIVVVTLVLTALGAELGRHVEQDDDVLAFLPDANPDIRAFREINQRFGSTDIALVGIAVADPFAPEFVKEVQAVAKELKEIRGIDSVMTFTNVADFVQDPSTGGIITSELVTAPPADEAEKAALREKVMSRDHVVGTLVSKDADAVLLYAFATPDTPPRTITGPIRDVVRKHFPTHEIYWGGAPFISTWIYETTKADMDRLTPWAILAILAIMMFAYRDLLGVVMGIVATGTGIVSAGALMYVLGVRFNIVLGAMPVMLFALGSGYGIHILSHYDTHARKDGTNAEAVVHTIMTTAPGVVNAGFTTIVGLLSYVLMDIEPMQTFGWFTTFGLTVSLIVGVTFIPAFLALWPRPLRSQADLPWTEPTVRLALWSRRHRVRVGIGLLVVTVIGLGLAGRVETRMDLRAFFDPGTEPWVAQEFLDGHFGGSQFVQVEVTGDLEEPEVLREIGRIGDRFEAIDGVSDVQSIEDAMAIIAEAMNGTRRVPDTSGQVAVLYRFLASDPAVSRLVTDDHQHALIQVKIGTSEAEALDRVLEDVRRVVAEEAASRYALVTLEEDPSVVRRRAVDLVTQRVLALARDHAIALPADAATKVPEALAALPDADPGAAPLVAPRLSAFLISEESFVSLTGPQAEAVAAAVAALGPAPLPDALGGAIAGALALPVDDGTVKDLLVVLDAPLADAWRTASSRARARALVAALGTTVPETPEGERFTTALAGKLQDLDDDHALVRSDAPDAATLDWRVNGMPVLYQGLENSVQGNQISSLAFSVLMVLPFLGLYYRSPTSGLLPTAPMFLTLALIYGLMGLLGVHLDIGTSILGSLVVGVAVDYAVPLMDFWHAGEGETIEQAIEKTVRENSHGIWTNALTIAAGFFVLTLGDARPLKNVGGLTAAAMLVSAVATFVVVPLLAGKRDYRKHLVD